MKKIHLALLVFTLLILTSTTESIEAIQWSTNFNYKDVEDMMENGWSIIRPDSVTLANPGVILSGVDATTCAIGVFNDVPQGIFDWKVDAIGSWMGGSGHSYVNIQVVTERHSYVWAADGGKGKYLFTRDGSVVLSFDGYQERMGVNIDMTMHRIGNTIALYSNSELIKNYVETDTQLSRVIGVAIQSPQDGKVKYAYAGGYVPQPISGIEYPSKPSEEFEETNPNEVYPEGDIPEPPAPEVPPDTINLPPSPTNPVIIVMNPTTVTYGTDAPILEYLSNQIPNGVGQEAGVYVYVNVETFLGIQYENYLYESGQLAPESYIGLQPYGNWPVDYYVTVNMHVSGGNENPQAVGVVTVIITDTEGNTVYTNQITGVVPDSTTKDQLFTQGSQDANNYLQSIVNSLK